MQIPTNMCCWDHMTSTNEPAKYILLRPVLLAIEGLWMFPLPVNMELKGGMERMSKKEDLCLNLDKTVLCKFTHWWKCRVCLSKRSPPVGVAGIQCLCVAQRKAALCSILGTGRGWVDSLRTHSDMCTVKTERPLKAIRIHSMGMWDMWNIEWRKVI